MPSRYIMLGTLSYLCGMCRLFNSKLYLYFIHPFGLLHDVFIYTEDLEIFVSTNPNKVFFLFVVFVNSIVMYDNKQLARRVDKMVNVWEQIKYSVYWDKIHIISIT